MVAGPDPTFEEAMQRIGFPTGFGLRVPESTDEVDAVMAEHDQARSGRRYATPLLLTLVAQVEQVLAADGVERTSTALGDLRSPTDARGREANQLLLTSKAGDLIALRPIYNRLEQLVIGDMLRLGFPTGPGYNTGQWRRFEATVGRLLRMTPGERTAVAKRLWDLVTALDRQRLATGRAAVPRPFTLLLDTFEPRQPGENEGALLQALAYAYYRADAPNIDIDPGRSRAGSARTQRIGDIDGYSGNELVLTIEVKDEAITTFNLARFNDWLVKLPEYPNALAVALARDFGEDARVALEERGAAILDLQTMRRTVALWDLGKQQLAMRGFWFFLNRIEREPNMMRRFDEWCERHGITLWFSGQSGASGPGED
jgi:hypothetical protein